MSFDPVSFFSVAVSGVPLLFVVLGLVEFAKQMGATGRVLTAISLAIGTVLGGGYQVSQNGVPAEFSAWFAVFVYGLALGLVAAKFYDVIKGVVERAVGQG